MLYGNVTWEQFTKSNADVRGIRYRFEDLCRQLFINEFLSKNVKYRYVHSNPNNAGLESEPIYDEINHRWIGYQVKYFDGNPGYAQVLHSAEEIVKYYAGKVNTVYLYSNKPLKSNAKNLKKSIKILAENNISLELITGDTILDLVRKYEYLASYYFGSHTINSEWLKNYNKLMLSTLGERFNSEFNMDTDSSLKLSLFSCDETALKYINGKKQELFSKIDSLNWKYDDYSKFIGLMSEAAHRIQDIDYNNISEAFEWESKIRKITTSEIAEIETRKSELEIKRNEYERIAFENEFAKIDEKENARKQYYEISSSIDILNNLLSLPSILSISEYERQLIRGKVLAVTGEAGIGKSQLFANEIDCFMKKDDDALLLLAGLYYSNEIIQEQIVKNCSLDFSLNELIDIFEAMGEVKNRNIPIFVDALNETWNNALWKNSLPAIISKIEGCNYVKLAFSFRSEYQDQLMNRDISKQLENQIICQIVHKGFEDNSIEASRQFFNHYKIPFTPVEYFEYEMSNPLFLTLYCQTYNGEDVDLPTIYERLLKNANRNIHKMMADSLKNKGYSANEDLVTPFIVELASRFAANNVKHISKEELLDLKYWERYGITAPPFISQLVRENILHNYVFEGKEELYFAFDQMNDYYCAKAIISEAESKDIIKNKIRNDVLKISNGRIGNFGNEDLFVNICALYADNYKEECIDVIDDIVDYDKSELVRKYVRSFQWRNKSSISVSGFIDFVNRWPILPEDIWHVLIANSVKVAHPLNADFLHKVLVKYEINKRDYLWTIYINDLFIDDTNRITQLIHMYNEGESLAMNEKKQTELLLTLFSWFLTSSDRSLRDSVSKAMIEIAKQNFDLCEIILKKFEKVNDPYIIQRLYGIIFGACCKRPQIQMSTFQSLAEYVYKTVFDQKFVYPDVLMRDYARSIIERFLWENSSYIGIIDKDKIKPPYKSEPIPSDTEDYTQKDFNNGLSRIFMSMKFENMGMYGDFGRYVFQSALRSFDVDEKQIFNYAMSYIINVLGYKEEFFNEFDCHRNYYNYNRHDTIKTERIGKKYQWIAMHNILARVSDNNRMIDRFSDENPVAFQGPWEPYIRDFDPTLNQNFMTCKDAPAFREIEAFISNAQEENNKTNISSLCNKEWLNSDGVFLKDLKKTLILTDDNDIQWVALTKYCDTDRKKIKDEKLLVWSWLYAYFITPEQENEFAKCEKKGIGLCYDELWSFNHSYTVYNREYPWAPSCKTINKNAWMDAHIKTGEIVDETISMPYFVDFDSDSDKQDLHENGSSRTDVGISLNIEYKNVTIKREVEKGIGKILRASTDLLWEEEYDASKTEAISYEVPCEDIIISLKLRQLECDGFYYDQEGRLAAFDTNITQENGGVVIRKDLLDSFLKIKNYKLVWFVNASKEIHAIDRSEWETMFTYNSDSIKGIIHKKNQNLEDRT